MMFQMSFGIWTSFAALSDFMPEYQEPVIVETRPVVVPPVAEPKPKVKTQAEKDAEIKAAHPTAIFLAKAVMLLGLAGFVIIPVVCLFSDLSMGAEAMGMAFASLLIAVGVARLICWLTDVPFSLIKV